MCQAELIDKRARPPIRNEFVRRYRPLVFKIAKEVGAAHGLFRAYALGDLASFGFMGLVQALDNFDSQRNVSFISYAYPRIKGAILDGVRGEAHISRWYMERAKRIYAEYVRQCNIFDRREAITRTADLFGVPESRVQKEIGVATEVWQEPTNPEVFESLSGSVPAPGLDFAVSDEVQKLIQTLPPCLQTIIKRHYFDGRQKKQIAVEMGKSGEWVRAEIEKAERMMRHAASGRGLRDFLNDVA